MEAGSHRYRPAAGQLFPDIIRNLKASNQHLRAEKESAVKELKRLQVSIRATQMDEVTRENKALLDEVDRLRQMNDVLKKQLAAREETCTAQITSIKEELQQHKRAVFQALSFCLESSASEKLGVTAKSKNPVEVQIQALMDFLSTQASRLQKELMKATGQATPGGAESPCVGSILEAKAPKPKPRKKVVKAPAGPIECMEAASRAVSASVEELKSVAQMTFACNKSMRASARSLGNAITTFVKLHTQLEPSLAVKRSLHTVVSSQGSCARPKGPGSQISGGAQISPAPSLPEPNMPVAGFFGAASLQSQGCSIPRSQEASTSGQDAIQCTSHHKGDRDYAADSEKTVEKGCTNTNVGDVPLGKPLPLENCAKQSSSAEISEGSQPVKREPAEEEPLSAHAPQDNLGEQQSSNVETTSPEDRYLQAGAEDSHSHYTSSISSSVFSDEEDPSSCLAKHAATQPANVPSSAANIMSSSEPNSNAPTDAASVETEAKASDGGVVPNSKQDFCSDVKQLGQDADTLGSKPEDTNFPDTDQGDSRSVSGTDYSCSEVDTIA